MKNIFILLMLSIAIITVACGSPAEPKEETVYIDGRGELTSNYWYATLFNEEFHTTHEVVTAAVLDSEVPEEYQVAAILVAMGNCHYFNKADTVSESLLIISYWDKDTIGEPVAQVKPNWHTLLNPLGERYMCSPLWEQLRMIYVQEAKNGKGKAYEAAIAASLNHLVTSRQGVWEGFMSNYPPDEKMDKAVLNSIHREYYPNLNEEEFGYVLTRTLELLTYFKN